MCFKKKQHCNVYISLIYNVHNKKSRHSMRDVTHSVGLTWLYMQEILDYIQYKHFVNTV